MRLSVLEREDWRIPNLAMCALIAIGSQLAIRRRVGLALIEPGSQLGDASRLRQAEWWVLLGAIPEAGSGESPPFPSSGPWAGNGLPGGGRRGAGAAGPTS